jgi:hypothetical protein
MEQQPPAQIRIITVKQKRYLQAARYSNRKTTILQSFGPLTPENFIHAQFFVANFNLACEIYTREILNADPALQAELVDILWARLGGILGPKTLRAYFPPPIRT